MSVAFSTLHLEIEKETYVFLLAEIQTHTSTPKDTPKDYFLTCHPQRAP